MKRQITLELSSVSIPAHVLAIDDVAAVPAVGDYVQRDESGWYGYVKSRRWDFHTNGNITVRCWIQKDPP